MFSKLFTTVREFISPVNKAVFLRFFVVNLKKLSKTGAWRLWEFENRAHKSSFSHSVYVSAKAESCISGLSGWKTKGSLVKPHCHLNKRLSYIRNYKRLCVWFNSRLTSFSCTWVSRLRRDLLIVMLYMLAFQLIHCANGKEIHSFNLVCNSPYCQRYNSFSVSSESLILDQLIIPKMIFSLFSLRIWLTLYRYCKEIFCLGHS